MEKNGICQGIVSGLTHEGMGVVRVDNMVVFLPAVCVGDEVSFQIVKLLKSYAYGRLLKVIKPSPARIDPLCGAFPKCGGCVYRAMDYAAEAAAKASNVVENFKKLGNLEITPEEVLTDAEDRYRNKAIFPVAEENGRLVAGFYAPRSHRVIPVEDCLLQPKDFALLVKKILAFGESAGWKPFDRLAGNGDIRHIFLRKGFATGEVFVTLISAKANLKGAKALANLLVGEGVVGVALCVNSRKDNVLLTDEILYLAGETTLKDDLCGLTFTLSPRSFYQVNPVMTKKLYEKAAEFLDPQKDETLLDLYCGAGTIGLSMARRFGKVIGVEVVDAAIENAKENAARNSIENAEFYCADASLAAEKLEKEGLLPDAVVLDPPRKGCDTACLDAVLRMHPKKLVMISCNPATAARDAAYLVSGGYKITRFAVADLFPRTSHVECLMLFSAEDAN